MNGLLFDTAKDTIESIYTDGNLRVSVYREMNKRDRAVICKGLANSILDINYCLDEGTHKDHTSSFLIVFRDGTRDLENVRGKIKTWLTGHLSICNLEQPSLF